LRGAADQVAPKGTITTDLFAEGETSYFDDPEQFFALQQEAVERLASEYEGKAAWVELAFPSCA